MTPNVVELKESQCFSCNSWKNVGKTNSNQFQSHLKAGNSFLFYFFFATVVQVEMLSDVSFLFC